MSFEFGKPPKLNLRGNDFEVDLAKLLNDQISQRSHELRDKITDLFNTHYTRCSAQQVTKKKRNKIIKRGMPLRFANSVNGGTGETVCDVILQGDDSKTYNIHLSLKDGTPGWMITGFGAVPRDCAVYLSNFVGWDMTRTLFEIAINFASEHNQQSLKGYWKEAMRELKTIVAPNEMNPDLLIESVCNVFWDSNETGKTYAIIQRLDDGKIILHRVDGQFRQALHEKLFDFEWSLNDDCYVRNSGIYLTGMNSEKEKVIFDIRTPVKDLKCKSPSFNIAMSGAFELPFPVDSGVKL